MKIYNLTATIILSLVLAAACNKVEGGFENKAFINADNLKNEVRVATDENVASMTKTITVGIAQPEDKDINISVVKSPELLDTYRNAFYHEDAELLPDENCNLDGIASLIKAGDVISDNIDIAFNNLDKLDYNKQYVMPVTVVSDGIAILDRAKTMYFVIKEASLVNFVADMDSNRAWPVWDNWEKVSHLEQFTMECLVNCYAFKNELHTIMGVEEHFLIRIGDTAIPANQLQISVSKKDVAGNSTHSKPVTDASLQLMKDRWYHIAVTFNKGYVKVYLDGRLRVEADRLVLGSVQDPETGEFVPFKFEYADFSAPHSDESDGKPRCFWLGYSYDDKRCLNGMIAEARVWNRVLSEEEINSPNHFYKLYPEQIDESLLAYWKFSDGKGKFVKDHSIYGHDLEADHDFVWYPVELPK